MSRKRILYLIRHAQSKYNYEEALAKENNKDPHEVNLRKELIDAYLTNLGESQAQKANNAAKELDITTVYVSPLRRALQTAQFLFQGHKNKPKMIVLPLIREKLGATCDIPEDLNTVKAEFPLFDFSIPMQTKPPEYYLFDSMRDERWGKKFLQEYLQNKDLHWYEYKTPSLFFYQQLVRVQGDLESRRGMKKRVEEVKQFLLENTREDEKIALVSHGSYLKAFTATEFAENGYALNGHLFENCEILQYELS